MSEEVGRGGREVYWTEKNELPQAVLEPIMCCIPCRSPPAELPRQLSWAGKRERCLSPVAQGDVTQYLGVGRDNLG